MAIFHRIPERYLWLIPALYFAALGSYDIVSDLLDHKLTLGNAVFNACLFAPIIFRHRIVHIVFGVIAACFSIYFLVVLLVWFGAFLTGVQFRGGTFSEGLPFSLFSLLCNMALIIRGALFSEKKSHAL